MRACMMSAVDVPFVEFEEQGKHGPLQCEVLCRAQRPRLAPHAQLTQLMQWHYRHAI